MSKGGGQTQTTKTEIPKWVEDAGKENLERARYVSQLGYVPNYGLDVAAFSPLQQQAMQASGMAGQAFGLAPQGFDATAGIPTPQVDAQGFSGYSSGNMFDNALAELYNRRPAQYEAMQSMFVNPQTGDLGTLFTPNGSVGTNNLSTYQASQDTVNQLTDQFSGAYDSNGMPTYAQDWNKLSPEAQKIANFLIPSYGLLAGIEKLATPSLPDPRVAPEEYRIAMQIRDGSYGGAYTSSGNPISGDTGINTGNYSGTGSAFGSNNGAVGAGAGFGSTGSLGGTVY